MTFKTLIICICVIVLLASGLYLLLELVTYSRKRKQRKQAEQEYIQCEPYTVYICDACGKRPKKPNSMLCKECEEKAYDISKHQEHT